MPHCWKSHVAAQLFMCYCCGYSPEQYNQTEHEHTFLTHLSRMEFPTDINWTSPYPFLGVLSGSFHFNSNFDRTICKQKMKNLIRRHFLWRLIWFSAVCPCVIKRTLCLNGLSSWKVTPKQWQLSCHLMWCKVILIFTMWAYPWWCNSLTM